ILLCLGFWAWRGRDVPLIDAPSPRLPCVSYAPFRDAQSPFDETLVITREQIEDDLGILAGLTGCVRIYSVDQGLAQVPAIAERLGLEVLLGAWLGRDPERNANEIASVIELANRHPETIRGVVVGNEVLLRGEMPPDRLIEQIRSVAAAVEAPVTYADVWEFWLRHPEVAGAVDLLTIHVLPYWEDQPVAVGAAVGHVGEVVSRMRLAVPGKPILIGEVGWPSRGRMRERALPSPVNQARFVREMLVMAERDGLAINLMEGMDQPWKRRLEGTVGGFWGVLDTERSAKFPMTGPVSAEPRWAAAFVASAGLALLPILGAAVRKRTLHPWGWGILAFAATGAACSLVLTVLDLPATSLGALDWAIGIARLAIAAASLALTTHIALAGAPATLPTPAVQLLERVRSGRLRGMGNAADALGWLRLLTLFGIAATSLCLAVDGRYRDFPVTAHAPAVACFVALAWLGRGRGRTAGGAREEAALAAIGIVAAGAVVAGEGVGNGQAMTWAGVALAAATIPALELWRLEPDRTQGGKQDGNGAEFGVVEHERSGAGGGGHTDGNPA
ncbi:MAG TPA: hypothetical protein VLR47_04810, partial [Rhodospirillales bacterium]|nr:hypothetical protein [Rhodospirillales bacterium]